MTAKELQQRNEKADHLRVLQTDDGQYFVESGEGKILYNVIHQAMTAIPVHVGTSPRTSNEILISAANTSWRYLMRCPSVKSMVQRIPGKAHAEAG